MSDEPILEETEELDPRTVQLQTEGGTEELAHWVSRAALAERFLKAIAKDTSFKDFVTELLLEIVKIVKCEAASVLEVASDRPSMFFRASTGFSSDRLENIEIPMGQGIAGHVATTRQPYIMNPKETEQDPKQLKTVDVTVDFKTRNMVALPLSVKGKIYGVLELLNRVGDPSFSEKDLEVLKYASELAAKAIEIRMMMNWLAKKKAA